MLLVQLSNTNELSLINFQLTQDFVQLFDIDVFNKLFANAIIVSGCYRLENHTFMDLLGTPSGCNIQNKLGGLLIFFSRTNTFLRKNLRRRIFLWKFRGQHRALLNQPIVYEDNCTCILKKFFSPNHDKFDVWF